MLPPLMDETAGGMVYSFVNPINNNVLRIKKDKSSPLPNDGHCYSYHGWLAFIDPHDCGLYLWDPFHSYSNSCHPSNAVIRLPSIETLPCVADCYRRDGEIEHFVMQECAYGGHAYYYIQTPESLIAYFGHSLTFSSAPSPSTENTDCTVMAIFKVEGDGCLAFCKLGDTSWTALDGPLPDYTQITYSTKDQVFYAMCEGGEIEAWDLHDHSSIKRIPIGKNQNYCTPRFKGLEAILREKLHKKYYLLESSEDLLLIIKHFDDGSIISNDVGLYKRRPYETLRFDVYKLDSSMGKWIYIECLGDCALFLGLTYPLCVHNFPGLRPNCIYFADDIDKYSHRGHFADNMVRVEYNHGGHDLGIFNLKYNKVEPYYPFGHLKRITPPSIWVTPNLNNNYAV